MNKKEVIEKIKSRGYWQVNLHPSVYSEKLIQPRSGVLDVVEKAKVSLRGWDYPHLHDRVSAPVVIDNGREKLTDLDIHKEYWKMTQSLNFFDLIALREDWDENKTYSNVWSRDEGLKKGKTLGVLSALYSIIEFFEFSKRLVQQDLFKGSLYLEVELSDLLDRELVVDGYNKVPFMTPKISYSEKPWKWAKEYKPQEITTEVENLSLQAFIDLVELFQWTNPPVDSIRDDIKKFLEGLI